MRKFIWRLGPVEVWIWKGGIAAMWRRSVDTAQARWDAQNLKTMGTRLRVEQAQEFDRICAEHGITRYEAIRRFCCTVILKPDMLPVLAMRTK